MSTPTTAPAPDNDRLSTAGTVLLVGLTLVWGLNWTAMKIVLGEFPVWWFRSISVTTCGVCLLGLAALSGGLVLPRRSDWPPLLICTVFAVVSWHIATAYGISLMPAGRASIIACPMPL